MNGITHMYSNRATAHVGARLHPKDKQAREVYRIEYANGYVCVSDMLDEGHFLQPTIEKRKATPKTYERVIEALIKKYETRLKGE